MTTPKLPAHLNLQRITDEFTAETVPAGLLREHRIASGVWGVLRVRAGRVRFVFEDGERAPVDLRADDHQVIEPDTPHHIELDEHARFVIEFHR